MDIADRTQVEPPSGSATYDGFISYSHAADDLLAPRLQSGLQRFAKPWWKRRAVRIFRDESSLAANPHLWSSITQALDDSSWFVLLLSEDAASSEWVGKEIEHWIDHKPSDRILPVVTDGTFGWDGDVTGSSVPPALRGVFGEEPRWVDLRFARDEESLDLQNPDFSAAVADIAATIRGVPKDELASEEVKQHRRTVRTAWAAGITVTVLAVAALVAGVFAIGQRNDARDAQDLAEQNATLAQQNADRAETEADRANQEADRASAIAVAEAEARAQAETNAQLAEARELAASAVGAIERDPELALLLTLSSFESLPSGEGSFPEGKVALRNALNRHRLSRLIPVTAGETPSIGFLPDGRLIVSGDAERSVELLDLATGDPVWTYKDLTTHDTLFEINVSADGRFVAAAFVDRPLPGGTDTSQVSIDENGADPFPGRVVVLDATDGSVLATIAGGGCPIDSMPRPSFSPDGSLLLFTTGTEACFDDDPGTSWIAAIDTATWTETQRFEVLHGHLDLAADMQSALLLDGEEPSASIVAWPSLEPISRLNYPGIVGAVFPDGTRAVLDAENDVDNRPALMDASTGAVLDRMDGLEGFIVDLVVSPDGRLVAAAGTTGVFVWTAGGELVHHFRAPLTPQARFSPDGRTIASAHADGFVRIWDLSDKAGTSLGTDENPVVWINADKIVDGGPNTGLIGFTPADVGFALVEPTTGETLEWVRAHPWVDQLPDGRFVLYHLAERGQVGTGPLVIWDPTNGSTVILDDCPQVETDDGDLCQNGERRFGIGAVASEDGTQVGALADVIPDGEAIPFRVWDVETGAIARTIDVPLSDFDQGRTPFFDGESLVLLEGVGGIRQVVYRVFDAHSGELVTTLDDSVSWRGASAVSADHSRLYLGSTTGEVYEYDTATWTLKRSWSAQDGRLRGISLSPDGTQLLSTGEDGHVMIYSLDDLRLVDRIPVTFPSDAMWVSEDALGIAVARGSEWRVVTLREDDLLAEALEALTRSYTPEECRVYGVDPCPTLEELRAGT